MKVFLKRSLIGICFGSFVAVLITNGLLLFGNVNIIDGDLFIKNSLISILYGWIVIVSSLIFEVERLNLLTQTMINFILIIVPLFIIANLFGWIPFNFMNILFIILVSIVIYIIIWGGFYFYFKNETRKMNENLKKL